VSERARTASIFGLGLMGRPIARSLLAAGHDVRGWNRSRLDAALTAPVSVCRTLAEAAGAEVALLVVSDSDAVDAVLRELESLLAPGQIVVDMGTSDPARSREHARRLAQTGIGWVDAPVSGGPEGAESRRLAIMAGGSEEDCERVEPLLGALGSFVRVGGPGDGHTAKLANQVIAADCASLISLLA
jgi:2-hydroxy-3-oxopropionate reductase